MGELFINMSNLVLKQSETIKNIEDDIEIGLQETIKGFEHINTFYRITKGNRSMIFKIFALLLFFILLFLVWT